MSDYQLDATGGESSGERVEDATEGRDPSADRESTEQSGGPAGSAGDATPGAGERLGIEVPDEHVAAFVAEAFEDPERDATWEDVVDEFVPADARERWRELSMRDRVEEVLAAADDFDDRAIDRLDDVPLDRSEPTDGIEAAFDEAMRLRRNADTFRSGIADAHAAGRIDDDGLVAAVEGYGFETDAIAEREDLVEAVAERYELGFRPYGGTLMDTDDPEDRETGEVW
ncbi:hypothetical protein GRX01_02950 [Halobaculum sp. WSA2]|uniref:Uncharacterized protein n=1 Tax=Halobaculum saliterrae TaxID=2073113 RepID=A0A6B0SNL5_9EURY|nr:hypothetical protein [Halobaculum saliterrae]MXR40315.1 hypothetical protein [Halobaculum saliterrae]